MSRIGNREFRGRGRSRRPQIGGKIADGEIGLVSHRRNHGDGRSGNRAGHPLIVERPQFLDGSASPADDEHIGGVAGSGTLQGREAAERIHKLGGRSLSLHEHRGKENSGLRIPPSENVEDIANGSPRRGRDHAHQSRIRRERPFAPLIEQPLFGELCF